MINSGWVAQMLCSLVKMRAPDVATALSWRPLAALSSRWRSLSKYKLRSRPRGSKKWRRSQNPIMEARCESVPDGKGAAASIDCPDSLVLTVPSIPAFEDSPVSRAAFSVFRPRAGLFGLGLAAALVIPTASVRAEVK